MNYQWAEGFRPPKGVDVAEVAKWIESKDNPSPDNLLDASKNKKHCLHQAIWSEGDQIWAQRGRLEFCRKILGAVKVEVSVGGRLIQVRSVEFVKVNGDGRWIGIGQISEDAELRDAYLAEIVRLQEQASAKMAKFRELLKA